MKPMKKMALDTPQKMWEDIENYKKNNTFLSDLNMKGYKFAPFWVFTYSGAPFSCSAVMVCKLWFLNFLILLPFNEFLYMFGLYIKTYNSFIMQLIEADGIHYFLSVNLNTDTGILPFKEKNQKKLKERL